MRNLGLPQRTRVIYQQLNQNISQQDVFCFGCTDVSRKRLSTSKFKIAAGYSSCRNRVVHPQNRAHPAHHRLTNRKLDECGHRLFHWKARSLCCQTLQRDSKAIDNLERELQTICTQLALCIEIK